MLICLRKRILCLVKPYTDEDGYFSGNFETPDGHNYVFGNHEEMGAFIPRPPYGMNHMDPNARYV